MASKPPGKCCVETNFHEGSVQGKLETIYGLDTYVVGSSDSRFIVLATDIYGHKYNNARLVADQFAKAGYKVYVPDILNDDPVVSLDDLGSWLEKHTLEITEPLYAGFLTKLREEVGESAFIGSVGYCFGAKYVVRQLTADGLLTAGGIAHPSFVDIEEVAAIKKPLVISAAEVDSIYTAELRHQTEEKLAEIGARYQATLFSGVSHGFACRGDMSDPVVKYAAEKSLSDHIAWFNLF